MRRRIVLAAMLALAACASEPPSQPEPPPVAAAPPPPPPAPDIQVVDSCRAGDYRRLVGRPRVEIPVPVNPDLQRVACTTCPITMDYNPERLNFFFDARTGIVREVRCG